MLPPLSLPIPMIDPPDAMSEDSPPDEPPEPLVGSKGLHVLPNIGLLTSYLNNNNSSQKSKHKLRVHIG